MRLGRFAAFSLIAALGVSSTSSDASAVENSGDLAPVVASVEVGPDGATMPASHADAPDDPTVANDGPATVVDVNVGPEQGSDPATVAADVAAPTAAPASGAPSARGIAKRSPARIAQAAAGSGDVPFDFGTPPSSVIPILFNDRHIYAKPDELRRGRLLAALVKRDGSIMVPLRSLFGEFGASVAYDPASRTIALRRAGVDVTLTVGKPSIVIDGETRPLDVPPEIVNGIILVPVRVCSEIFGAYVQYIPTLRAVSIRYLAPTAPPPAQPVSVAPVPPPPTPAPGPRRIVPPGAPLPKLPPGLETIVVVDTMVGPRVNNEFAKNAIGPIGQNYQVRGATEFDLLGAGFELDAAYRQQRYAHPTGPVNAIDGGSTIVPAFVATENQFDAHLGVRLTTDKFYLVAGYATQTTHYGYPRVSGLGFGIAKLPALDRKLSLEGSLVYYPNLSGQCASPVTCPSGPETLAYSALRYHAGIAYAVLPQVFLEAGYLGDSLRAKAGFPSNVTYGSPFAGLGARF